MQQLRIDTQEDRLPPGQGGRQLRGRKIPPIPPPRSLSVPISYTREEMSKGNGKDASPLVFSPSGQYTKLHPGMDTSDAESIDQQLRFVTTQLKEHFRIEDDSPDTATPEGATSPSPQLSSHRQTSSSENEYMTPWKQPLQNPHYFQDEIDVEDPLFKPQQKPSIMSGEVYFNFCDNLYRTLGKNEVIDLQSIIYHVGQD